MECGDQLHSKIPSPYDTLNLDADDEVKGMGLKRRTRRAAILAAARKIVIEERFTGFSVKKLADACGVSTQAIFSRYSSKDKIIGACVNDYTLALFKHGYSGEPGCDTLLNFVEALAESCVEYPEFFSRVLPNTHFDRNGELVYRLNHSYGTILLARAMTDTRSAESPPQSADLRMAGLALSTLLTAALYEWASGAIRVEEMRQRMIFMTGLIRRGLPA